MTLYMVILDMNSSSTKGLCQEGECEMSDKNPLPFYQSAVSGLWYKNWEAAGDISAIRFNGELYIRATPSADEVIAEIQKKRRLRCGKLMTGENISAWNAFDEAIAAVRRAYSK